MLSGMAQPMDHPMPEASPRLTYLIKRVELGIRAQMEEALRPRDVTVAQYTALSILETRGGLSSAQLARRHFVTPQAMNQLVAALEADGLIAREPDRDNRRILRAHITDRGREVVQACNQAVGDLERRMLADLSPEQVHVFRWTLQRCLAALANYPSA
jgi:DNA-binding MarR family transcriptional regulator